jgi:hypothetical protein
LDRALSSLGIKENSTPDRLIRSLSMALTRKQYERLPADGEGRSSLSIEVRNRANLGNPSRQSDIEAHHFPQDEVPPSPSTLKRLTDSYVDTMMKTAENASSTSVVPVAATLDRSLTLGRGFGTKVEVVPTEANLGFKLTKAEQMYLDHLRRRYDGRYA